MLLDGDLWLRALPVVQRPRGGRAGARPGQDADIVLLLARAISDRLAGEGIAGVLISPTAINVERKAGPAALPSIPAAFPCQGPVPACRLQ